eukprot:CAMPEP_0172320752 /NCGR_PEP_ID=MMETSP1058-20130122/41331_1 /TAXON_ID=83371 /ORGANISM="Detonula confervacea, Strain CCMP 353" /LENGTH=32 /DNA_ID= /DNA_START= /DNA_END= /DNA_ORIENTATION=
MARKILAKEVLCRATAIIFAVGPGFPPPLGPV